MQTVCKYNHPHRKKNANYGSEIKIQRHEYLTRKGKDRGLRTRAGDLILLSEVFHLTTSPASTSFREPPPCESLDDVIWDDVIGRTINSTEKAFL